MLKTLSKILLAYALFGLLASCGFTPPVAGPSQSIGEEPGADAALETVPLPLVESNIPWELVDIKDDERISADPSLIYTMDLTDGVVTNETSSFVKIEDGTFAAGEVVTIYGMAEDVAAITSPPFVTGRDLDEEQDHLQLEANDQGGLEFLIIAGYSEGNIIIVVEGVNDTLSELLFIQGPEE